MKRPKKAFCKGLVDYCCSALVCCLLTTGAFATEFTISDIRIDGLQRVKPGVIFALLPVTAGDLLDETTSRQVIRALFDSGYFNDIRLVRDDDELIIEIVENSSIGKINIKGNKAIPTDNLREGLATAGLAEDEIFQRATLAGVEAELQRLYTSQGRYSATIKAAVQELPLNQVSIDIDIEEGAVSRIVHINLVGNKAFTNSELLNLFELKAPEDTNVFSNADRYSREKLKADLETLESYCQDRGYVNFRILSTQVSVTPDKKHIYITVNVDEGERFKVVDVQLVGEVGDVPVEALKQLLVVTPGTTFSRALVTASEQRLLDALSDAGYSFANVTGTPEINEEDATVEVRFFVDTGQRVYVRRINFYGNTITGDEVLRRELRQIEGGWASSSRMELSKVRLERLGLFKEVNMETVRVAGTEDQIDIDFSVEEQPSGSLSASIGYASSSGLILSGSFRENNLAGTGNNLDVTLSRSDVTTLVRLSYFNPYATLDGVSRGYNIYTTRTNYSAQQIARYSTESLGGGVNFGVPIRETERLQFEFGVDYTTIQVGVNPDQEHVDFFAANGNKHLNYKFTTTWSNSRLNRGIFPTAGHSQNINLEVSTPGSDLQFYKIAYFGQKYFPMKRDFALRFRTRVGFGGAYGGTSALPFYENFFAGGYGSVRGFRTYSLGPRTTPGALSLNAGGLGDPLGGNLLLEGTAELIFSLPFFKDQRSVRSVLFFDAGQAYNTKCSPNSKNCFGFSFKEMRYSTGVSLTWLSPLGPLNFSYAFPFNTSLTDQQEAFQFEIGGRLH